MPAKFGTASKLIFTLAAIFLGGCASIDDVKCSPYDDRPESIRRRVLGGLTLPAGAQVIECRSIESKYEGDDEACLLSIAPADFEATFTVARYGSDRARNDRGPYASTPHQLAKEHGMTLDWLRSNAERDGIFSNEARDRVVVYRIEADRCFSISEII